MNTRRIERIIESYNPEFDVIPNGPSVTWAANDLAEFLLDLVDEVEKLKTQLSQLTTDKGQLPND